MTIRVMLVDDHRSILWGLERLINGEKPRMEVVATATGCSEAVQIASNAQPDVVVLDVDLAGENGSEIIPALIESGRTKVVILTGVRDAKIRQSALILGASGIVDKQEPAETILTAIERVYEGNFWLDQATAGQVLRDVARSIGERSDVEVEKAAALTPREREVVEALGAEPGTDNRALAERLGMAEHTLRNHLSRIYDKLGVANRLELYIYAQRQGLRRSRNSA